MESIASVTLRKARLFVEQARRADPNDRDAIATNLEAAIVFCRSVTFHLQSQFAHSPGFTEWYEDQQKHLNKDCLSRFMLEQRNYVLKVGSTSVRRMIDVSITASIFMSGNLSIQVIRSKPWYKRSPKTLFADLTYPLRQRIFEWRQYVSRRKLARSSQPSASKVTRDALFFTDSNWGETPALDLISQQLSTLGEIVAQAEARFSPAH